MKKVCIIYTGGTIGMVQTERGFAPKQGALNKELLALKDLSAPDMPKWDLVEFDPLLDSSNTTYKEWNMMGEAIASRYDDYDGFVILHGTDTMAYTASALSFMLENLGKPVILTGSQIPLCQLRSDGKDNLITSLLIAADGVVPEVCLYFGNKLLRGNRAYKSSADRLIAFTSPNYPSLATAGIEISYNKELMLPKPDPDKKPFRLTKLRQTSIGVIKLHPGIHFDLFAPMVNENLEGLVLETFGTGNIPNYDHELPEIIKAAIANGTVVVVGTQCAQGRVRLGAYDTSSELAEAGAVSGENMTTEAIVTKLAWLLSLGLSRNEIHELMEGDLRGELDHRI